MVFDFWVNRCYTFGLFVIVIYCFSITLGLDIGCCFVGWFVVCVVVLFWLCYCLYFDLNLGWVWSFKVAVLVAVFCVCLRLICLVVFCC